MLSTSFRSTSSRRTLYNVRGGRRTCVTSVGTMYAVVLTARALGGSASLSHGRRSSQNFVRRSGHTSAGCLRQQNTHCDAVCGACHVGMRRAGVPPMCSAGPRRVTSPATAQRPACAPCARNWSTTPLLCSCSLHLSPMLPSSHWSYPCESCRRAVRHQG